MGSLTDLAKLLQEEQTREIPVEHLTEQEKISLGVKEGQKTVKVRAVPAKYAKETVVDKTEDPISEKIDSKETVEDKQEQEEFEQLEQPKPPIMPKQLESVGTVPVGAAVETPKIEVTLEEKKEYLRCALAMIPYKEEFKLLDGKVRLVLKNTNSQEALRLVKMYPVIKNKYGYANAHITAVVLVNLQFAFYLDTLEVSGTLIQPPIFDARITSDEDILKEIDDFNSRVSSLVYKVCLNKWEVFNKKVLELERQVSNENF